MNIIINSKMNKNWNRVSLNNEDDESLDENFDQYNDNPSFANPRLNNLTSFNDSSTRPRDLGNSLKT